MDKAGYITSNKEWKIIHPDAKVNYSLLYNNNQRSYYSKPDFLKYSLKDTTLRFSARNISNIIQSHGVVLSSLGFIIAVVCKNNRDEFRAFVNSTWILRHQTNKSQINKFLKDVWGLKPKQIEPIEKDKLMLMFSGYQPGFYDFSEEKQHQLSSEFLNSLKQTDEIDKLSKRYCTEEEYDEESDEECIQDVETEEIEEADNV